MEGQCEFFTQLGRHGDDKVTFVEPIAIGCDKCDGGMTELAFSIVLFVAVYFRQEQPLTQKSQWRQADDHVDDHVDDYLDDHDYGHAGQNSAVDRDLWEIGL